MDQRSAFTGSHAAVVFHGSAYFKLRFVRVYPHLVLITVGTLEAHKAALARVRADPVYQRPLVVPAPARGNGRDRVPARPNGKSPAIPP